MIPTCLALLATGFAPAPAEGVTDSLPDKARLRIGTTRLRHGGLVRALAFSPDGKHLASASHDQTVSVWDVPSGRERFRCLGHEADVLCVAFTPSGEFLASGAADGTVRLWEMKAGKEAHVFRLAADSVESVAFSPDGKQLAVGADDGHLLLFDVASRKETARLSQDRGVRCVAWSADGKRLAASGAANSITVWDVGSRKALDGFGSEPVQCLAFAPKGRHLVSRETGGTFRLWDADRGLQMRTWQGEADSGGASAMIYQLAFRREGKEIVAGTPSGTIEVWDAETGKRSALLKGRHRDRVTAVAVSPNGDLIASGGADHIIHLWSKDQALTKSTEPAGPVLAMSLSANGSRVGAVVATGGVEVFDRATGRAVHSVPREMTLAAFDGESLLVGKEREIVAWNLTKKTSKRFEVFDRPLTALAVSGTALATIHRDGTVWMREAAGKPARRFEGKALLMRPVLSSDGQHLVAVGREAPIPLWQTKTGGLREPLAGHRGGTLAAAFSPASKHLASGGRDRLLRVWDLATGKQRGTALRHDAWLSAVAYSSSGAVLATGTVRGEIVLWDLETRTRLGELRGHRGAVTGLAFADGGKTLISSSLDTSVLVWAVGGAK